MSLNVGAENILIPPGSRSSLVLEFPFFLDDLPGAGRLCRGLPTFLCALQSLVHSCKISTRTRLRSLPPSLAFPLSNTHASHALPVAQACPSPETPQAHTGRRQRSRWASNAESWCPRGASTFCGHVRGHDVGVAADTMELVTRGARRGGHAAGAATQRAQGVTHGGGATSWCRGRASTFCMQAGHRSRRGRGCYFCMHLRCNDQTTWGVTTWAVRRG